MHSSPEVRGAARLAIASKERVRPRAGSLQLIYDDVHSSVYSDVQACLAEAQERADSILQNVDLLFSREQLLKRKENLAFR
mmetsp:Transcript_9528/g.30498  ORF Transcript_9528/g.30498 Transcript_9528/m.30498 type:complete len:81 (+) Transcript_9528:328-570(+)